MLRYLDGDAVQAMESALLRGGGSCSAWMEHRTLAPTHRRLRWGIFISGAVVVVGGPISYRRHPASQTEN